jgi:hypothetical protein
MSSNQLRLTRRQEINTSHALWRTASPSAPRVTKQHVSASGSVDHPPERLRAIGKGLRTGIVASAMNHYAIRKGFDPSHRRCCSGSGWMRSRVRNHFGSVVNRWWLPPSPNCLGPSGPERCPLLAVGSGPAASVAADWVRALRSASLVDSEAERRLSHRGLRTVVWRTSWSGSFGRQTAGWVLRNTTPSERTPRSSIQPATPRFRAGRVGCYRETRDGEHISPREQRADGCRQRQRSATDSVADRDPEVGWKPEASLKRVATHVEGAAEGDWNGERVGHAVMHGQRGGARGGNVAGSEARLRCSDANPLRSRGKL